MGRITVRLPFDVSIPSITANSFDPVYLGGGYHGQRLNKLYRSSIKEEEILDILKPLFKRYALEREEGERFGDFCIRIGYIKPTTEGKTFHDDVSSRFLVRMIG